MIGLPLRRLRPAQSAALQRRCRDAVLRAREEACELKHDEVDVGHLLIGWLREGDGLATTSTIFDPDPELQPPEGARREPAFHSVPRLSVWDAMKCVRPKLWDEDAKRLVGRREAHLARA
jgi:hypothetical protein